MNFKIEAHERKGTWDILIQDRSLMFIWTTVPKSLVSSVHFGTQSTAGQSSLASKNPSRVKGQEQYQGSRIKGTTKATTRKATTRSLRTDYSVSIDPNLGYRPFWSHFNIWASSQFFPLFFLLCKLPLYAFLPGIRCYRILLLFWTTKFAQKNHIDNPIWFSRLWTPEAVPTERRGQKQNPIIPTKIQLK